LEGKNKTGLHFNMACFKLHLQEQERYVP